jgi:hypothetical protein
MSDERRLEIVPVPSDTERAAIAAALASLREDGRRETPAWWQAGVCESVGEADAESEPMG